MTDACYNMDTDGILLQEVFRMDNKSGNEILNDLFGKEVCEPLFGGMNLFASSGGLPVWANLMLAITDEVQFALQGELAAREQRIAKYVEKYKK